ncbi:MAG: helix-turn-helix domain-containing protein [Candidatus Theseobacter exili]|nr:helix-turn-helix domain-containing protein [Candidatus Theseobacter exili]
MNKIGGVLRDIRLKKGLTLTEIATDCGVTKGLVSQIENDKIVPPLQTLSGILNGLDMTLTEFFFIVECNEEEILIRKEERVNIDNDDGVKVWNVAARCLNMRIEPRLVEIRPRTTYLGKTHPQKEFVHVISGCGEVKVGKNKYEVKSGDSLVFSGMLPFAIYNKKDELFKAISILKAE